MTSQQDTELNYTQDLELETILYAMAEDLKRGFVHSSVITTKQALTSWKDKEVMAAYRQGYNDNSRDCYCDSPGATEGVLAHRHLMDDGESHNIKPDVESLQSQGGKNE